MRCFGHWTDAAYQKGVAEARKDERLKTIKEYAAPHLELKRIKDEHFRLTQALRSCVIGATEAQSDSDGFVSLYVIQTGPIHRANSLLQQLGFNDRPGFDSLKEPL